MNKFLLFVFFIFPFLSFSQEKIITGEQMVEKYLLNLQEIDNLNDKIFIIENRISSLNPNDSLENITILSAKQRVLDLKGQIVQKEKIVSSTSHFIFDDLNSLKRPIIELTKEEFELLPDSKKAIVRENPNKFLIKQI